MKNLESLAAFLQSRKRVGTREFERLVFRNRYGESDFPYKVFGELGVVKVDVMVPW
jgi:hypothetical protein